MNPIIKIALLVIGIVSLCPAAECRTAPTQQDSLVLQLYFRQSDALLLRGYRDNDAAIEKLLELRKNNTIERIILVSITGSASPNGNDQQNEILALDRAKAVRTYIYWKMPELDRALVQVAADPNFCTAWLRAVEQDTLVPRRDRVLEILRSDTSSATKWANVQQLTGDPARYLEQTIFPYMRNAVSCVVMLKPPTSEISPAPARASSEPEKVTPAPKPTPVPAPTPVTASVPVTTTTSVVGYEPAGTPPPPIPPRKPLFALKTNLLFDAATMLNLELEVPIGQRWSIAGEVIVPWWLWEQKQHCIQLMSGNIEGKYWFGNRQNRTQLTGWFAGLYVGGGYYDLEWNRTGYQGEFFIALGVSGGYAHTINRRGNLRMEYTLGIGYMQTGYRQYEAKIGIDNAWHLYRRESGTYKWFGPTRLKISLVWMLDCKGKGGVK